MARSQTKSKNSEARSSKEKTSRKSEARGGKAKKSKTDDESDEEDSMEVYQAALSKVDETMVSLKEQVKALKNLAKAAFKRKRKAGTASPNNAFTRQMGIPPALIKLLRHPDDNTKLNKASTLSRSQLQKSILNYCKKNDLATEGGHYKPNDVLREALHIKSKKETFNGALLQRHISNVYKIDEIVPVPIEGAETTKKGKKQLKEEGSDDEGTDASEEAPKRKARRSNA